MTRDDQWIFSAKRHSTTLSPDRDTVFAFDLEGRPVSWYVDGCVFKRSLSSEVHGRERRGGSRRYWQLTAEQRARQFERIHRVVAACPAVRPGTLICERIERIRHWPPERLLAEGERFERTYRPVTILPPDQYLSIVLQATFGCTWNRCTFCSFYQDRTFQTRNETAFAEHCAAVAELIGEGAALRRDLFLADGNALTLSTRRLLALFEIARSAFPGRALHGFVDVYTGEQKSVAEWTELRSAGLRRVHLGVESGDDRLLAWLNKPGSAAEARELVRRLKRSGLLVSAILLVGAGGDRFAGPHVRHTLDWIRGSALAQGDIVYLSPFRPAPDSQYERRAHSDGVRALDADAARTQYDALRFGIREIRAGVRVARYDIREFIY